MNRPVGSLLTVFMNNSSQSCSDVVHCRDSGISSCVQNLSTCSLSNLLVASNAVREILVLVSMPSPPITYPS